jgi:hypothetical protein
MKKCFAQATIDVASKKHLCERHLTDRETEMSITETEWAAQWSADERRARMLAQAVNECMTRVEAELLLAVARQGDEDWTYIVEGVFDARGWPDDDLSELWLDATGEIVWQVYQMYRGF